MKDDTHLRWENQDNHAQNVWEHYNKVIAPQIIRSALRKAHSQPISLNDLYQVLSIARLRCEFEKKTFGKQICYCRLN